MTDANPTILEYGNQSQGLGWPSHPDLLPLTGVIVTLNYAGEVAYYRGLIRSDDRDAVRAIAQEYDSDNTPMTNLQLPSQQTVKVRPVHSEKLIKQLSANKTGIVAAMLASASRQALALLAAHLGNQIFCHYSQQTDTIKISLTPNGWKMKDAAPDFEGCNTLTIHHPWMASPIPSVLMPLLHYRK